MSYPSPVFLSAIPRYARLLVRYSARVEPGEDVAIRVPVEALPLGREIVREVLRAGAYPTLLVEDRLASEVFFAEASEEQLKHISPVARTLYREYKVLISILAEPHTKLLMGIDPSRQAIARKARAPLVQEFLREAAEGRKKWSLAPYPTLAMAQEAGMRPYEYEEFVYRALKLHHEDPVRAWEEQSRRQRRILDEILSKADEIRITGPGIDLLVKVGGRKWISDDGHENMPGGEVFTGPVEESTEGCVSFDLPQVYGGYEVEGVKLCFRRGEVVEYDAVKGRDFLEKMIGMDEGARKLGEIAFGLNYDIQRRTKEILFDEKIGGTIHMALGNGYPETGSRNQSALHWDLIKDLRSPESKVYVDGDLVYEAGKFHTWG